MLIHNRLCHITFVVAIIAASSFAKEIAAKKITLPAKEPEDIEWGVVIGEMIGGLALFMYGIKLLSKSMKVLAGDQLKDLLSTLSMNQIVGMFTGIFVTVLLQSSTLVSLMMVEFVSSGLMNFSQTIGILLGAGIGSTSSPQIMTFNVRKYSLYLIAIGFAVMSISKKTRTQYIGTGAMGLGLTFYGTGVISRSITPLKSYEPFLNALIQLSNHPLLAILISLIFTALIQSSNVTIGIVIVLASQKLLELQSGIWIVLGSNIGTGITPVVSSFIGPEKNDEKARRESIRVALANILFKIAGVMILFPAYDLFAFIVVLVSPVNDLPRQIANAHSLFNVLITLLFLPFSKQIANLITNLVPDKTKRISV